MPTTVKTWSLSRIGLAEQLVAAHVGLERMHGKQIFAQYGFLIQPPGLDEARRRRAPSATSLEFKTRPLERVDPLALAPLCR